MAGKNEIKHRLTLEGDDDVAQRLRAFYDKANSEAEKHKAASEKNGGGFGKISEQIGGLSGGLGKFREAIAPLLEGAGLGSLFNGIAGGIARIASGPAGLAGLAGLASAAAVAMAKLDENSKRTDSRLQGLGANKKSIDELGESAKRLGVSKESLAPGLEENSAARAKERAENKSVIYAPGYQPPDVDLPTVVGGGGAQKTPSNDLFRQGHDALINAAKAGRSKDPTADADKLISQIRKDGNVLKGDAFREFTKAAPEGAKLLTPALEPYLQQGLNKDPQLAASRLDKTPVPIGELFKQLKTQAPTLEKEAAGARGVTEAFTALQAATGRLTEKFSGDHGVTKGIDAVTDYVQSVTDRADKILNPREYEPGGKKFVGPATEEQQKEYNKPDILDVGKALFTGQSDERFKDSNAIGVAKAVHNGPEFLQKTPEQFVEEIKSYFGGKGELPARPGYTPNQFGGPASEPKQPPPPQPQEPPTDGRRYSRQLNPGEQPPPQQPEQPQKHSGLDAVDGAAGQAAGGLQTLATAVADVAAKIASIQITSPSGSPGSPGSAPSAAPITFGDGGAVERPRYSGGSYVSRAATAVKKAVRHFAAGGEADDNEGNSNTSSNKVWGAKETMADLGPPPHTILYDADHGGAQIDGVYYPPGHPLLDDPEVKAALKLSAKGSSGKAEKKKPYVSPFLTGRHRDGGFIPHFDGGGSVSGPGTTTSDDIDAKLSHGEFVTNARETAKHRALLEDINSGKLSDSMKKMYAHGGHVDVPRFADGGAVSLMPTSSQASPSTSDIPASSAGMSGDQGSGYHVIDHRMEGGTFRTLAPAGVARAMNSAARDSAHARTGARPSWYNG